MYAKMKELGPIGGGVRPARPPRSANDNYKQKQITLISYDYKTALAHPRLYFIPRCIYCTTLNSGMHYSMKFPFIYFEGLSCTYLYMTWGTGMCKLRGCDNCLVNCDRVCVEKNT